MTNGQIIILQPRRRPSDVQAGISQVTIPRRTPSAILPKITKFGNAENVFVFVAVSTLGICYAIFAIFETPDPYAMPQLQIVAPTAFRIAEAMLPAFFPCRS
jgi:hypothetical protein